MNTSNLLNLKRITCQVRLMNGTAALLLSVVAMSLQSTPVSAQGAGSLSAGPGFNSIESKVEDNVEEQVEEQIAEQVEEEIVEKVIGSLVAGAGFNSIEDKVEDSIEEAVEEAVNDAVADNIEITIEDNLEDDIEQDVEETLETIVEQSVEEAVEQSVEESVEQSVEVAVEESVEEAVEQNIEVAVEDSVEEGIAESVETTLEETVEEELAANVEQDLEAGVEESLERDVEGEIAAAVEERLEGEIDEILEKIEIDESRINKDQWLVMAEPEAFEELAEEGYLFSTITELPGMGLRLAEVTAPSSFDISNVRQGVIDVVGKDRAEVDLNHIYTAGSLITESVEGMSPRVAMVFPEDIDQLALKIGMIDSNIDIAHPSLNAANIHTRLFTREGAKLPDFHGTAIASIIVANSARYQGIAPKAQVFAAAVFEDDSSRGEIASTVSLVRALDWLVSSEVDVVNISLAGPPNRLLETALNRVRDAGVTVMAAAGNGGPAAQPMFPAAYESVVAVTAVDSGGRIFRLANRGEYLDLAAPGVDLLHAHAGGGYSTSSGTSFAVPFTSVAVARLKQLQPGADPLDALYRSADDLGPPGRDDIYGYGLLHPL
jgi:subtilisin family serine protease